MNRKDCIVLDADDPLALAALHAYVDVWDAVDHLSSLLGDNQWHRPAHATRSALS
jgi:hypothetical protein